MKIFPKDPFETVEARIILSGEGKVMGVTGGVVDGVCVMESQNSCFWIMGPGYPWEVKALVRLEV